MTLESKDCLGDRMKRQYEALHSASIKVLVDALSDAKAQLKRSGFCYEMDEAVYGQPDIYKRIDRAIEIATGSGASTPPETPKESALNESSDTDSAMGLSGCGAGSRACSWKAAAPRTRRKVCVQI